MLGGEPTVRKDIFEIVEKITYNRNEIIENLKNNQDQISKLISELEL